MSSNVSEVIGIGKRPLLLGGIAFSLTSILESLLPKTAISQELNLNDPWEFLTNRFIPVELNYDVIMQNFVPLGLSVEVPRDSDDYQISFGLLKPTIDSFLERVNQREYESSISKQIFGMVEIPSASEKYKMFCESAFRYSQENTANLQHFPLETIVINRGDNFEEGFNGKAFIGGSWFRIYTLRLNTKSIPINVLVAGQSTNFAGSFYSGDYLHLNNEAESGFLFLSSRLYQLLNPFVEFMALNSYKISMDNKTNPEAVHAYHLFLYSTAIKLAVGYLEEKIIPIGRRDLSEYFIKSINQYTKMMINKNDDIGNALKWLNSKSIQDGVNLYIQSPVMYMKAIRNINPGNRQILEPGEVLIG